MRTTILVAVVAACLSLTGAFAEPLPGAGDDAGKTVIYRDTWGVPHIYSPTVEGGMYAMGWAQAEDRPEQLLMNLKIALGESAELSGKGGIMADMVVRALDHYGVTKANADSIDPTVRAHVQAFVRGINDWYAAHPEDVPAWWGDREVDEHMIGAFGRLFLYNWSVDDGIADMKRGGVEPGIKRTRRGSNQWAVAPERSANGKAILYIDPHLGWFGPSRFWEFRVHAGDWHGSGFTLAAQPYIGLGHNDKLAWAMTTGGPDTADTYELTLNPDNPMQYKYDDEWRDITVKMTTINIKDSDPQETPLYFSHHGPIIAMADGKAYALKTAYADVVRGNEAWYHLNFAKDYKGAKRAMADQTMFPQNVMVADTDGNIYYQRSGRVPIRPEGYDWTKPVDGSTSATEWQGFHPSSDLVQILNPDSGYMQNCNVPPDAMFPGSPMLPSAYPGYIFSDVGHGPRGGWSNERSARAIELLDADDSVTIEEALTYALDQEAYSADRWVRALFDAFGKFRRDYRDEEGTEEMFDGLRNWDQQLDKDSNGALMYVYWREALRKDLGNRSYGHISDRLDQYYVMSLSGTAPRYVLDDEKQEAMVRSLSAGAKAMTEDFGSLDAVWGDRFRVGRDDKSWPVGGGGTNDTGRTLRSMSYSGAKDDHTQWGRGGQTSTQIVVMTQPVQSWSQPPIGQSDRPDSPHYTDQAEKLYSPRQMKETWWLPEALAEHVESRVVLEDAK